MIEVSSPPSASTKYPNRIQFLVLFILVPMVWNGVRFVETLVFWKTLKEFHAQPGPLYMAVSGAAWFTCGIMLLVGVGQRKSWGWYATLGATVGYALWDWADRLILQQPQANQPFAILVTFTYLSIVIIILISPKTKRYYHLGKGNHEHQ